MHYGKGARSALFTSTFPESSLTMMPWTLLNLHFRVVVGIVRTNFAILYIYIYYNYLLHIVHDI